MTQEERQRLTDLIRSQYALCETREVISPATLADDVYKSIDPDEVSPFLVKMAAILSLRQLARAVCRKRFEEESESGEAGQDYLFDLQPRYPATRNEEEVYVIRACLTLDERRANIKRLRTEAQAKSKHADALEAETDVLIQMGALVDDTVSV